MVQIWKRSGNIILNHFVTLGTMITKQLVEFHEIINSAKNIHQRKPDRQTRKLFLFLFAGTRGGFTRLKIIMLLLRAPCNMHQLSKEMGLDYKAIQHNIQVLEKNNMVSKLGEKYGVIYRLSDFLELNIHALDESIEELDRQMNVKKVYY